MNYLVERDHKTMSQISPTPKDKQGKKSVNQLFKRKYFHKTVGASGAYLLRTHGIPTCCSSLN